MKGEALSDTLVDTPPEEKVLTFDGTMADVQFKPLLDTRGRQERETNLDSLGNLI